MRLGLVALALSAAMVGGCTAHTAHSFPTPGSYNPLAVTRPVDPGAVAVGRELDKVDRSIENGRDSGQLSKKQARGFRKANRALENSADRLGSDGLSQSEQRDLETHARILDSQVQAAVITGGSPRADR